MIPQPEWLYGDVETGGFDRKKHAILEIGWVLLDRNLDPITGDSVCILPEPGFEIDPKAAEQNGYTPEAWEERGAVSLREAQEKVRATVGVYAQLPKLAHNAFSMDKPWIELYFPFLSPPGSRWYCTKEQYRRHFQARGLKPGKGDLTLENLCKTAGFHRIDRHSAMEDSYGGAAGAKWLVSQGIPIA